MAKAIDWMYWLHLGNWTLAEGVCLSLGIDGDRGAALMTEFITRPYDMQSNVRKRLETARRTQPEDFELEWMEYNDPLATGVVPRVFVRWAKRKQWSMPAQMLSLLDEDSETPPRHPTSWPWGDYTTRNLEHLAAAAEQMWGLYDPADPSTAPTNEQVIALLRSRGVSDRLAKVMATILRADDLPTGPRK